MFLLTDKLLVACMNEYLPLLIIAMAVAMVIGPIMLFKPSVRDSQLAKMRAIAVEARLKVNMSELVGKNGLSMANYVLPLTTVLSQKVIEQKKIPEWSLIKQDFVHPVHFHHEWDWASEAQAPDTQCESVREALRTLPEGIKRLSFNATGLSVTWNERAKAGRETEIVAALRNWMEVLLIDLCRPFR